MLWNDTKPIPKPEPLNDPKNQGELRVSLLLDGRFEEGRLQTKKSLARGSFFNNDEELVGASGIEPPTTTMSRWCSTTELRACSRDSTTFLRQEKDCR